MSTGYNAPFGLMPVEIRHTEIESHIYGIATLNAATALFVGDLMMHGGTSYATKKGTGIPAAVLASATGALGANLGPILAIFDSNMDLFADAAGYMPASTVGDGVVAGYVLIADSPMQRFLVQEDGAGGAVAAASVGLNAEIALGSGSTLTGLSGHTLHSSSVNTNNTYSLKILELYEFDTAATIYQRFIVMVNAHHNAPNVVGI